MNLAHLPESLRETAALIGLPATLKLVERDGGVRLYVPQTVPPGHALAELLGTAAADKLARAFGGGEHFDVPRCVIAARRARDEALAADYIAHHSYRMLALKYHLTERGVRKIIERAGLTADDRQTELF